MKYIPYIVVLLLSACSKQDGLPAGLRAGSFKLVDNAKQLIVIKKMDELLIPYEIDEKGSVWFMQKDLAEVRKLKRKVTTEGKDTQFSLQSEQADSIEHLELYKAKFDAENIPYNIEIEGGFYNIIWRGLYADKVDQIAEDVGFEYYKSAKSN